MKILGIETSCDETAAAVIEDGTKILSNVIASSSNMHTKTGGIIPEMAARQQVRSIIPVIEQSLSDAFNIKLPIANYQLLITKIDALAITVGPGLIGSLLVGVETAKTLASFWKKPIVPVNHLAAHIYANWIDTSEQWMVNGGWWTEEKEASYRTPNTEHITPQFPALALVVSGGHTDLVLMRDHPSASSGQANIKWIGGTRDDAAGEAFDKCARLLGLPYPGGPAISAEAEKYFKKNLAAKLNLFPRPMLDNFSSRGRSASSWDWSFSGLKTAVLRTVQRTETIEQRIPMLAAEIQEAIVDCLVEKSIRAAKLYKPRSFLLAGGVAANKRLKEKFNRRIKDEKLQVYFHVPPTALCTDNASYIASYAFFNYHPIDWRRINANPGLTVVGEI